MAHPPALAPLNHLPMAMLELLPRPARAGRIARHAAPRGGIVQIDRHRRAYGHLDGLHFGDRRAAAEHRLGVVLHHAAEGGLRQRRRFGGELDAGQHGANPLAHVVQHRVEQREGFGFIFVQRIALAIGAQADALAQVVQGEKVFFPDCIENLQKQGFFDEADDFGAEFFAPCRQRRPRRRFGDAVAQAGSSSMPSSRPHSMTGRSRLKTRLMSA